MPRSKAKAKPTKPARRRAPNSDESMRAAAFAHLDANGGNERATARQLNIPLSTLRGWIAGRTPLPSEELRAQKKLELADRLELFAHSLASVAPDHKRIRDIGVTLGITVDKLLLLTNRANNRTETSTVVTGGQTGPGWDWTRFTPQQIGELAHLRAIGLGEVPAEYECVVVDHDAPDDPPEDAPATPAAEPTP